MCCGLGPRGLLILISCWAILQSIIYLVFSVLGILISNCSYSMAGSKFNYLLYLAYFRDGSCGPIDWPSLGLQDPGIVIDQPAITAVVSRTGAFLYAYLALSALWIVTSMSLIVATFTPCMSLLCLKVFSFPWVVTCIGVLILDVVATVYHIIDITNTTTTGAFLSFLEIQNVDQIQAAVASVPEYLLPLPSVAMMIVSIRGVLLWAVNLACLFYVITGVKKMLRNELGKQKKAVRPDFGYERDFNRAEAPQQQSPRRVEDQQAAQMTELSRYNDASVSNQYQYDNNGFQAEPAQAAVVPNSRYVAAGGNYVFVSEKRYMEPLKGGIAPRSEDGMSSRASNSRSLDSVEDASRSSSNIGSRSHASPTERTTESDNELVVSPTGPRLSYLSEDSVYSDNNNNNINRRSNGPPPILVKPSMVKQQQQQMQHPQYMRQHQQIREEELYRTSYQTPPDELRSQLPWSYFQDRDDTTRPQKQRHDDELLPPVPVPDYTLHFPKKERPPTKPKPQRPPPQEGSADNSERWSGPEYTY